MRKRWLKVPLMMTVGYQMHLGSCPRPQDGPARLICPGNPQQSCDPMSQQPPHRDRRTCRHQAVRCAAVAPKDTVKQAAAPNSSSWAQSMGIDSSGLRVADFAGDTTAAKSSGHHETPLPTVSSQTPSPSSPGFELQWMRGLGVPDTPVDACSELKDWSQVVGDWRADAAKTLAGLCTHRRAAHM